MPDDNNPGPLNQPTWPGEPPATGPVALASSAGAGPSIEFTQAMFTFIRNDFDFLVVLAIAVGVSCSFSYGDAADFTESALITPLLCKDFPRSQSAYSDDIIPLASGSDSGPAVKICTACGKRKLCSAFYRKGERWDSRCSICIKKGKSARRRQIAQLRTRRKKTAVLDVVNFDCVSLQPTSTNDQPEPSLRFLIGRLLV